MNEIELLNSSSPDGGLLQSEMWRAFQESVRHPTFHFESPHTWANVIEYTLPVVGRYWYIPRGPVAGKLATNNKQLAIKNGKPVMESVNSMMNDIVAAARGRGVCWIRFDPVDENILRDVRENGGTLPLRKAPHDMQPREIFKVNINRPDEELLSDMKPKTRYNIRLAEKRGVRIFVTQEKRYQEDFLNLVDRTAERNHIAFHPRTYYETFFVSFPAPSWELLVAEYSGEVLAANLVVYFGNTATYLYGASGDGYREYMAPYLVQWEGMRHAREQGCLYYDFGGIDTVGVRETLRGVTRFKQGFSKSVNSIQFPGSYDIVLKESHYQLYRALQVSKSIVIKAKRYLTKV